MTDEERFEAWFNWYVKEIMPYYKAEVIQYHQISEDEYDRRTLEGDQSIYMPNQIDLKVLGMMRVVHVLNLSYQELQDKFNRGELEHKRGGLAIIDPKTGEPWYDENPVVF